MNEDNKCEEKGMRISLVHFVYFFVIFVIIIVAILSLEFGGSGRAGENLNFGATLASIILAVIAILYTLFDSSSQKKNSDLIQTSVKDLRSQSTDLNKSTEEIKAQIQEMRQLNSDLLAKLVEVEEWKKETKEDIEMKASGAVTVDELKKIIDDSLNRRQPIENFERKSLDHLESAIMQLMFDNKTTVIWRMSEIHRALRGSGYPHDLSSNTVRRALNYLVQRGILTRTVSDSGDIFFSLTNQ